jgi:hypothetical protein
MALITTPLLSVFVVEFFRQHLEGICHQWITVTSSSKNSTSHKRARKTRLTPKGPCLSVRLADIHANAEA